MLNRISIAAPALAADTRTGLVPFHPLADIFPMMLPKYLSELADDIAARGCKTRSSCGLPTEEQREIVAAGPAAVRKSAKKIRESRKRSSPRSYPSSSRCPRQRLSKSPNREAVAEHRASTVSHCSET